MNSPRYRWILTLLRYVLCIVAVAFLVWKVNWYDHLELKNGQEVRLIGRTADSFVIQRHGQHETIGSEEIKFIEVEGQKQPKIDPGIASVVQETDLWPNERNFGAIFAILIFFPATLLQGLRLVWMLAIQDVRLSFWLALKLSFAGNFFNFALPGTTGGDVIKAYYITRFTHHKTEAVTAVFLDRAVGLFGLVILAGTMICISWDPKKFRFLALVLVAVCAGLAIGALLVFSRRLRHAVRLPELARKLPGSEQLLRIGRATIAMRHHKTLVLLSLLNTVALQFIVMISAYFMAQSMGMRGTLTYYLIYVPIGFLIAAIPIAPPQAAGVMEVAYIQFFARTGLGSDSQAVAFALAVRLIQLVSALPGLFVPLFGAHLPSKQERAEMGAGADEESGRGPCGGDATGFPAPAVGPK